MAKQLQQVHRARRVLLVLLAGVLAVIAGVTLLVWATSPLISAQLRERLLPPLSAQLGRPVEVRAIRVGLFPPRGEFDDVRIGGPPGEPPLAEVPRVRGFIRLLPLILSWGHDVELRSLQLDQPRINLIRERDGRWSFQGGERTGASSGGEFTVSKLRIRDGTLRVIDRTARPPGGSVNLKHVEVTAQNPFSDKAMNVDLSTALASERPNVKVSLTSSFKENAQQPALKQPVRVWDLRGRLTEVDFGRAMRELKGSSPLEGKLDAHLDLHVSVLPTASGAP